MSDSDSARSVNTFTTEPDENKDDYTKDEIKGKMKESSDRKHDHDTVGARHKADYMEKGGNFFKRMRAREKASEREEGIMKKWLKKLEELF